jgi:hypothetical protein
MLRKSFVVAVAGLVLCAAAVQAADLTAGMKKGTPTLKSAGPIAFAPEGILLVGDPVGAAIYAIDTVDRTPSGGGAINVTSIGEKIAARLGTDAKGVQVADLAVNPASGKVYLSVARGQGPTATPVLLRVDSTGEIGEVSLNNVNYSQVTLTNVPAEGATDRRGASQRMESITDLAFFDGKVIVAGLSNEEFASKLRVIAYPFKEADAGASVEIWHGAHGAFETRSPVRTFATYTINKEPHLLAAYTCTPLVKFPLADLKPGATVKGTTIAELGNRNRPLDMIVYKKDGKDYILTANNSRGVMKISADKIDSTTVTEAIRGGGTAGLAYETIKELQGVEQLDKLSDTQAVILARNEAGALNLQTIPLP